MVTGKGSFYKGMLLSEDACVRDAEAAQAGYAKRCAEGKRSAWAPRADVRTAEVWSGDRFQSPDRLDWSWDPKRR